LALPAINCSASATNRCSLTLSADVRMLALLRSKRSSKRRCFAGGNLLRFEGSGFFIEFDPIDEWQLQP
jgi:hypothetical protein